MDDDRKKRGEAEVKGEPKENALRRWFGERRIVRLMLLAALLTLGVIHVESIINTIIYLWNIAKPLIIGAALAYILEIRYLTLAQWLCPEPSITIALSTPPDESTKV